MTPRLFTWCARLGCLVLLVLLIAACSAGGSPTAVPAGTAVASRPATAMPATNAPRAAASAGPTAVDAFPSLPTGKPAPTAGSTTDPEPTTAPEPPVVATEQPPTEEVTRYTSERSSLSFEHPPDWAVSPRLQTQGATAADQVALLPPGGDALLLVQVFQLKRMVTTANLPRARAELTRAFAALARQNGGRVRSSAPFRRGDLEGYEYRLTFREGKVVRVFAVLAGNRQVNVQLEAKDSGQRGYAAVLDQVLSSLQPGTRRVVTKPPDAATPGRYESAAGTFAFRYPRTWSVLPVALDPGGAAMRETVALRSPDNRAGLIVTAQTLEREVRTEADLAAARSVLDAEIDQATRELGGAVVSVRPYARGDLQGFEYRVRFAVRAQRFVGHQYHLFLGGTRYSIILETVPAVQNQYDDVLNQVLTTFDVSDPS